MILGEKGGVRCAAGEMDLAGGATVSAALRRGRVRPVAHGPSAECRGEREEAGLRRGPCGAGSRELARAALAGRAGWRVGPRKGAWAAFGWADREGRAG